MHNEKAFIYLDSKFLKACMRFFVFVFLMSNKMTFIFLEVGFLWLAFKSIFVFVLRFFCNYQIGLETII